MAYPGVFQVDDATIFRALLRTRDGASPLVHSGDTVFTSLGFAGIFVVLGFLFLFLVLREVAHGPVSHTPAATDPRR